MHAQDLQTVFRHKKGKLLESLENDFGHMGGIFLDTGFGYFTQMFWVSRTKPIFYTGVIVKLPNSEDSFYQLFHSAG